MCREGRIGTGASEIQREAWSFTEAPGSKGPVHAVHAVHVGPFPAMLSYGHLAGSAPRLLHSMWEVLQGASDSLGYCIAVEHITVGGEKMVF